jgi:hypothetical protein
MPRKIGFLAKILCFYGVYGLKMVDLFGGNAQSSRNWDCFASFACCNAYESSSSAIRRLQRPGCVIIPQTGLDLGRKRLF